MRQIQLSIRRTFAAAGPLPTVTRLACPRLGRTVEPEQCLHCRHFHDFLAGSRPAVDCGFPVRAVDRATGPAATPVSDAMTSDVLCVTDDLPLEAAVALLERHAISGLPVVDASGRPVGVLSKTDLIGLRPVEHGAPVATRMMSLAFALPADASLVAAARLMTIEHMHRIPIVAEAGELIGLVTALDLVRWIARSADPPRPRLERVDRPRRARGTSEPEEDAMATREIPRKEWTKFFDTFSRAHVGDAIRVEVLRGDIGAQIEIRALPLDGITAERKPTGDITIAAGASPDDHIEHVVSGPTRVMLKKSALGRDEVLEIEAADQSTTLVYV